MAGFIRRVVVVIAAAFLAGGCENDDPPAVHYLLCAGIHQIGGDGWIAIIDCDTDSLVDSLGYPGMLGLSFMWGSPSGDFLLAGESGRPARAWDLRSRGEAAQVTGPHDALFLPDTQILVTSGNHITHVYSVPTFNLDTTLELSLLSLSPIPHTRSLLAIHRRGPYDELGDLSQLITLDLRGGVVTDSFFVADLGSSEPLQLKHVEISKDRSKHYVIGRAPGRSPVVVGQEASSGNTLFETPITAATGVCRLSPDGKELWVTDPGYTPIFGEPIWPGQVLVLSAATGAVIDTIPTLGLDDDPNIRWWVDDVQFVPGLNKAYVNCKGRPILVIDTKTKEVTRMIFGDSGRSAFSIAVVPRY